MFVYTSSHDSSDNSLSSERLMRAWPKENPNRLGRSLLEGPCFEWGSSLPGVGRGDARGFPVQHSRPTFPFRAPFSAFLPVRVAQAPRLPQFLEPALGGLPGPSLLPPLAVALGPTVRHAAPRRIRRASSLPARM